MNLFAVTSFLCGLLCLMLAAFTFFQKKQLIHRLLICFNISVAFWGFGCFMAATATTVESAIYGWKLAFFGGFYIATFYYHLFYTFCGIKKKPHLYFAYLHSVILDLVTLFFPQAIIYHTRPVFGIHFLEATPLLTLAVGIYLFLVTLSYKGLFRFFKTSQGNERQQAAYILIGFFFGFIGGTSTLFPMFGIDTIYPVGNIGICIYVLIITYAILRHRILDIRIVIHKTVVYFILASVVSSVYVGCVFFFRSYFLGESLSSMMVLNNILLIVVISLLVKPAELFLHRILDKIFFKGSIMEISKKNEELETELERSERLKSVGILAAGMAHEIKNPITAIKTFAEYLPQKYSDPEFREKFQKIVIQETDRIKDMLTNLLLFSKPSEPIRRECHLSRILQDVTDLLSNEFLKHKIKLETSFTSDDRVLVDPDQIKQAFLNIIMNAIDSMKPQGGTLSLQTCPTDNTMEALIQDTGCGIPADKLKHIFDPFFTDKEHGTGLGLAVTHSIIQKNGGRIEVESEVGQGTEFRLFLPLQISV